jgi:hypothetical protein
MKIEFEPAELDYVLKVLTQRPWAEVNQLLGKIQQQLNPSPVTPPDIAMRHQTGNGLDKVADGT